MFQDYIFKPNSKLCLVGIGGISMSALAVALSGLGYEVYGSDRNKNAATEKLEDTGIRIIYEHRGETVEGADAVIRTAAVREDNPEIKRARELDIPVIERAEAWGKLMLSCENVICISGCHGKSSSTGICTHIALEAGLDPTVMIGAELSAIGGNLRVGGKKLFIAEACEYYDSFLSFKPTVAVINNIEADHLDYFKDLDDIKESFAEFAALVPDGGFVCANRDDENVRDTLKNFKSRIIWYGFDDDSDVTARNIKLIRGFPSFELVTPNGQVDITLKIPGEYNVYNALSAAAAFYALGTDIGAIARGIESYGGISRRFELCGYVNGAPLIDDYAHHPTALTSLLRSVKDMGYDRIICAFQPHTYSRTAALYDDFKYALALADIVLLADVYSAREVNIYGVEMQKMADEIDGAAYLDSFAKIAEHIKKITRAGDIVLTVGAGDIWQVNRILKVENK